MTYNDKLYILVQFQNLALFVLSASHGTLVLHLVNVFQRTLCRDCIFSYDKRNAKFGLFFITRGCINSLTRPVPFCLLSNCS